MSSTVSQHYGQHRGSSTVSQHYEQLAIGRWQADAAEEGRYLVELLYLQHQQHQFIIALTPNSNR